MWTRCGLAACVAAAACLSPLSDAQAGAFAVRTQSAYGQGASFAGIAAGGSLSSMFWNPANLADVEHAEVEVVGTGIFPQDKVKVDPQPALGFPGSNEGNITHNEFVPAGYAAYRLNQRLVLGVGINTPYGLETRYGGSSIINQSGVAGKSEVFSVNLNPALSVEVTDWLALAVGAQIQYFDARLTRQALGPLGISTLDGDDVGFGFTAGLKLTPTPGTEIGLGYRSFINQKLDGTLQTANAGAFHVKAKDVNLPDVVTLGVRQRITDRFRVMAGAEWTNWSRFDTVKVKGGPTEIDLPFNYNDGWFFSGGGEFDVTDHASVRAGLGYELSPIDNDNRSYRLPYNGGFLFSVGASYRLNEHFSFDVGYSYYAIEDMNIEAANAGGPAVNGPFSGHADAYAHYLAAAIKIKM
jgi:long-chain fatty acid transport protein